MNSRGDLFRAVRLLVRNHGKVAAQSVRAELTLPALAGIMVVDPLEIPRAPERRAMFPDVPDLNHIRPAFRRTPGEISIDTNGER
ncbi:MAG: hypothetical protein ACREM3_29675, partial [Candidatus Rokuibacteriota bacterium]